MRWSTCAAAAVVVLAKHADVHSSPAGSCTKSRASAALVGAHRGRIDYSPPATFMHAISSAASCSAKPSAAVASSLQRSDHCDSPSPACLAADSSCARFPSPPPCDTAFASGSVSRLMRVDCVVAVRGRFRAVCRPILNRLFSKALPTGPTLNQRAVHGKAFVEITNGRACSCTNAKEFPRDIGPQQPLAIRTEHRRIPHRLSPCRGPQTSGTARTGRSAQPASARCASGIEALQQQSASAGAFPGKIRMPS